MGDFFEQTTGSRSVNQASGGTSINFKRIRHLIATPIDYRLDPSDLTGLKTKIQADAVQEDANDRIYIIKNIYEAEQANGNDINLDYNYGNSERVYNGAKGATFAFSSNNLVEQVLRQRFNGRAGDFKWILADEDLNFVMTQDSDATGGASAMGFSLFQFRANDIEPDWGVGAKQTLYIQFADWHGEASNGRLIVIPANINMNAIKQVADVNIEVISGPATRVVSLAFPIASAYQGANLAEKYGSILAGTPALALFTNHTTGASVTITTAVAAVVNGRHVITYTLDSTNYPTTGQYLDVKLDDVSALATALIKYYETPETLSILIP